MPILPQLPRQRHLSQVFVVMFDDVQDAPANGVRVRLIAAQLVHLCRSQPGENALAIERGFGIRRFQRRQVIGKRAKFSRAVARDFAPADLFVNPAPFRAETMRRQRIQRVAFLRQGAPIQRLHAQRIQDVPYP